ncbi:hypothetical protein ACFQ3Y_24850 [Paenibacillus motobuensis]|uniref:hypothetical protein n=1 Tax=Paenibacillus motobuensis TaxID=295324 RepID=UPI003637C180
MIVLNSEVYVISEIKRKTRAKVFEDWRVGDRVQFSTEMRRNSSYSTVYASMFTAINLTQGTEITKSQTELVNVLRSFEIVPEVVTDVDAA